ncbi:MAG: hypothetical protein HKN34_09390 [Gammaproteobacteria bacterium]|nr:hypothetical protein [Gammaproteobacteria bacterium]
MHKRNLIIVWMVTLSSLSLHLHASEPNPQPPAFCKNPDQAKELERVFPDAYAQAVRIRGTVCRDLEAMAQSKALMLEVVGLLGTLDTVFGSDKVSLELMEPEQNLVADKGQLTTLEEPLEDDKGGLAIPMEDNIVDISIPDKQNCEAFFANFDNVKSCKKGLSLFADLYGYAQGVFSLPRIIKSSKQLDAIEKRWEKFYQNSRSQTLFELAYNGRNFQDDNDDYGFRGPPSSQTILFHPSIVIENVSDAVDGQQAREGVLLEIWGRNYWENEGFTGYSLGVLFSDRPGDDFAAAVSVHYSNTMTLGISYRDGDEGNTGVFISYDFLKGLQDKKQSLQKYRDKIESQL